MADTNPLRGIFAAPESEQDAIAAKLPPVQLPPPPAIPPGPPKAKEWFDQFGLTDVLRIRQSGLVYIQLTIQGGAKVLLTDEELASQKKTQLKIWRGLNCTVMPKMPPAKDWAKAVDKMMTRATDDESLNNETDEEWYFELINGFLSMNIARVRDTAEKRAAMVEIRSYSTPKNGIYLTQEDEVITHVMPFTNYLENVVPGTSRAMSKKLARDILGQYFEEMREPGTGQRGYWTASRTSLEARGFDIGIDGVAVT